MKLFKIWFSLQWMAFGLSIENWMAKQGFLKRAYDFEDMEVPDQLENMGGFTTELYIALSADIASWPALSGDPGNTDEAIRLHGGFTMEADKYFHKVYCTKETAELLAEQQGEPDGQSFKITGEFLYPVINGQTKAMGRKLNNNRGVIILIDPSGDRQVIGYNKLPVYFKPSFNWGKAAADRKGMIVGFEADSFVPAFDYYGTIPLSAETIPAYS